MYHCPQETILGGVFMAVYGNIKINMLYNDSKTSENIGYTNANLLSNDAEQVKRDATAIDTFARGVAGLTKQTYFDSNVEYSVSINELTID